jgi:hypothetical protein
MPGATTTKERDMPIALEGMTVLPDLEVVPPVEEWNWTPATTDIDSAIERLFKAETPLTSRQTGTIGGSIDHGEFY